MVCHTSPAWSLLIMSTCRKYLENHHFKRYIVHLPQVLSRHGDVVVNVAGDLLVVRGHGSRHVVRVESSVSETMNQLNDVTMLDPVQGLFHCQVLSVNQSEISINMCQPIRS